MSLLELFTTRITEGLDHKSVTNPAEWAVRYRTLNGKPWRFDLHPWLYEPHTCDDEEFYSQKAAQIGFTELLLNSTFHLIDILSESVLYALPTQANAIDFSSGRFDPALEENPYLNTLFSDAKNAGLKRAGSAVLYVRGARSRASLKSIPTAGLMLDEIDEFEDDIIKLVRERASGQSKKYIRGISTPSIEKRGIAKLFSQTTQDHFFFKCPRCGKYEELTFDPDDEQASSLVLTSDDPLSPKVADSYYRCKNTGLPLPWQSKKEWVTLANTQYVSKYPDRLIRGFHCSQLYSHTITPYDLAVNYLTSRSNPGELQEFYNNKLGKTFQSADASVTDAHIEDCMTSRRMGPPKDHTSLVTMGVDVGGTFLHVVIDEWFLSSGADPTVNSTVRTLLATKVKEFEDLDDLVRQYFVNYIVIDAEPEARKSRGVAEKYYGMAKVCHISPSHVMKQPINAPEHTVSISAARTYWLDQTLTRLRSKTRALPVDIPQEFKDQVKALVRLYSRNKSTGNMEAKYESTDQDHYAFSCFFSEVAMNMSLGIQTNTDIKDHY